MTRPTSGAAAIKIIGDTSEFASRLQRDLDRALRALRVKPVAAFDKIGDEASNAFKEIGRDADRIFDEVARDSADTAREIGADFQRGGEHAESALRELDRTATAEFASIALKGDAAAAGMGRKFAGAAGLIRTAMLTVGVAGGAGLAAITGFGLKAAGTLEQSRIAFQSLLGSVDAGNKVFADLQKFAALTPFEFPDVLPFAQKFLAFNESVGLSDDQLQEFLTTVGNVVSVSGGGAEALESVARAFAHIASGGRVSLEDINILSDALPGFNGIAAIAEAQGISTGEAMKKISAGAISATEGTAALIAGMEKFPGAAGAMEKQSQTLLGVFSTFKDTIGQALAGAFEPVIPAIKTSLSQITPILGTALGELGPALGKVLASVLPLLGQLVQVLVPILTPLLDAVSIGVAALGPALGPLGAALAEIAVVAGPVLLQVLELALAFLPLVSAVLTLAPALLQLLTPALDGLLIVIGPLIPLMASFATFLGDNAGLVQDLALAMAGLVLVTKLHAAAMAVSAAGGLASGLASYLKTINLVQAATKVWTAVQWLLNLSLWANPIGIVILAVVALVAAIVLAWQHSENFRKAVAELWASLKVAGAAIAGALLVAWHAVQDFFVGLGKWFADLPGRIGAFFTMIGTWFSELPGKIGAWLASLPGVIGTALVNAMNAGLTAIGVGIGLWLAGMLLLPGLVWNIMVRFGQMIANGITAAVNWLITLPPRALAAIASMAILLGGFMSNLWANLQARTAAGVTNVLSWLGSLPGRAWSALSSLPGLISGLFHAAFRAAVNIVTTQINQIVGFIRSVPGKIAALSGAMLNAGVSLIRGFTSGLSRVGGFIGDVAGSIVSGIKGFLNNVISRINSGIAAIDDKIPFVSLPRLPQLATGGLTKRGGIAVLHPDEMVLPLESRRATDMLAQALREANAGLRATGVMPPAEAPQFDVRVFIGDKELTDLVHVQVSERDRRLKTRVTTGTGRRR